MVHIGVQQGRIVIGQFGVIILNCHYIAPQCRHPGGIGNFEKLKCLASGLTKDMA